MSGPHSPLNSLLCRGLTTDFSSQDVKPQTFQKSFYTPVIMHVRKTSRILKWLLTQSISRILPVQLVFSWRIGASTPVIAILCNLDKDNDKMKINHEQIDRHQSPSFPTIPTTKSGRSLLRWLKTVIFP